MTGDSPQDAFCLYFLFSMSTPESATVAKRLDQAPRLPTPLRPLFHFQCAYPLIIYAQRTIPTRHNPHQNPTTNLPAARSSPKVAQRVHTHNIAVPNTQPPSPHQSPLSYLISPHPLPPLLPHQPLTPLRPLRPLRTPRLPNLPLPQHKRLPHRPLKLRLLPQSRCGSVQARSPQPPPPPPAPQPLRPQVGTQRGLELRVWAQASGRGWR